MFTQETVFVIGAGCSREYGLPIGDGLRDDIAALLAGAYAYTHRAEGGYDPVLMDALRLLEGGAYDGQWRKSACAMADGIRHASSIDRFLHIHRNDQMMVDVGKIAITYAILRAERRSSLKLDKRKQLDHAAIARTADNQPHWLGHLFSRMQEDTERNSLHNCFDKVKFVCFNYDRCIEHYFWHAVKSIGNFTDVETNKALQRLEIYHPYGTIGRLPWEEERSPTDSPLPFALTDEHAEWGSLLVRQSKSIRTFTEQMTEHSQLSRIQDVIQQADRVIFMGFSFLDQNMELLTPKTQCLASSVFFTTYQASGEDIEIATGLILSMLDGVDARATLDRGETYSFRANPRPDGNRAGVFMRDYGNTLRR